MSVTSSTLAGVNTWQFSGVVTDAQIQTAWASLITNGVYVINRAIYLDNTCDLTGVTGGFLVDFGTQVNPAFILDTRRDKTKSTFRNFTFLQRTGLSVTDRGNFVRTWNGTILTAPAGSDGVAQNGGGMIYGVAGNPGGGDPRYLNEMSFAGLEGATIYSQEFTEQELQIVISQTTQLKGITFEKCYGFPQIGSTTTPINVTVYRSNQNTQSTAGGGLIPIRLFPSGGRYASVCYVDSYITRNNADINTRLIDTFGSNASNIATIMVLNNFTRESWFGASKTNLPVSASWAATNVALGGVLKKLQFVGGDGAVIRAYDSRSTTASQKCAFQETGTSDFLNTSLSPTTDANGRITLVHVGAIATGSGAPITRYTNQRYTYQKFGQRVSVNTVDMTAGGDNDLSAFTPVIPVTQEGITRTQAAINSATSINSFQELLEELHVLAIGLSGSSSYAGAFNGNLFNYDGATLTTSFATVNVDATAASKIAFDSATNTLTIKSSVLMDALDVQRWNNSAGVVNLLNGAVIQGVYQDNSGTSTVLTISGFDAGSSVYVEDNTAIQKFYSASATGTVTVYIPPTGTGSWYYAVEKYGNQRQSDFFTFSGGILPIVVKAIPDTGLTVLNSATVGAYTALETPDKVYDYVAYLRLSVPHISYGQIVFKDGTALDLQDADMIVNQSAASVASFNYDDKILTVKSSSMVTGVTYNLIKTTPPKTIEAATTEVISVNIEDANGDSSVNIQGGSGNFTLWKITNATPEDQYSTGTNLGTVSNENYRFLSDPGFKIVIRDNTTGFRQVVPMDKGNYTRGLFFGDQVQLAQSQEVTQINTKVDILANDIDAIKGTGFTKDTDSLINIKQAVDALENYDDTLTQTKLDSIQDTVDNISVDFTPVLNAVDALPTLTEIEASTVLAKEAAATANKDAIIAAIGTGGGGSCDLTGIEADLVSIKASTNTIEAATSKMTFDGHYINAVAKVVEDKANYTLTPDEKLNIANAVQAAILNESDGQKILEAIVNAIGNENIDQVALVAAIRADIERTGGVLATRSSEANATTNKAAILTAVGTPLQAANYTAPDNATIAKINDVKAKTDLIPTNTATQTDIATLKTDLEASIGSFPTKEEISTEVWADEPERLKRVATVETTGNQLAAFNH